MPSTLNTATWRQLGAAIDTLDDAIRSYPDSLWGERLWAEPPPHEELAAAWYLSFHAIFWLDVHVFGGDQGFAPPAPFTLDEFDPAGLLPDRRYTQDELRAYLARTRALAKAAAEGLTDERASQACPFIWGTPTYGELLLYTMRHVQEHAAQLDLFLGQRSGNPPRWVAQAR